jgi:UDP-N-acetylglucosamine--N-acetylmuramyl-(pentapeptide) pyrophosphoryl-undecaprenol N-acetylglucosamine transferase
VVDAAALTYEDALPWFRGKGFVTGNPVRAGFSDGRAAGWPSGIENAGRRRRVLVFGGSQGAHAINVAMMAAAPALRALDPMPDVVHQTGERDFDRVRDAYRHAGFDARVEPFLHDMDREMRAADLVVCRAGATTLAELTVSAKPALLIPLPNATDDHQRRNAEALARAGAADVLLQHDLSGATLADRIGSLLADDARRQAMARSAGLAARPDAARAIVDRLLLIAARRRSRA